MPKKDFAKELKEEFKKGNLKPSQLKRSKSSESLKVPKPNIPLTKSKSAEEINLQPSLAEQVKQLKQDLTFSQNTAQNYLERLQKLEPLLDNKEQELKKLTESNNSLIDKNNELRLELLKKDDQLKEYEKEIEKSVGKLVDIQQSHTNFKVQNSQLLKEKQDLETRLNSANQRIQNLYQLKGLPHTSKNDQIPNWVKYLSLVLISYGVLCLILSKNHE